MNRTRVTTCMRMTMAMAMRMLYNGMTDPPFTSDKRSQFHCAISLWQMRLDSSLIQLMSWSSCDSLASPSERSQFACECERVSQSAIHVAHSLFLFLSRPASAFLFASIWNLMQLPPNEIRAMAATSVVTMASAAGPSVRDALFTLNFSPPDTRPILAGSGVASSLAQVTFCSHCGGRIDFSFTLFSPCLLLAWASVSLSLSLSLSLSASQDQRHDLLDRSQSDTS